LLFIFVWSILISGRRSLSLKELLSGDTGCLYVDAFGLYSLFSLYQTKTKSLVPSVYVWAKMPVCAMFAHVVFCYWSVSWRTFYVCLVVDSATPVLCSQHEKPVVYLCLFCLLPYPYLKNSCLHSCWQIFFISCIVNKKDY